ncbi:MAG: hypothetical protein PHD36_09235, partial [Desulfotomaculaceae bacterium]|nr:hypothetical protein [Desulfotomaculaceae bacterium]
YLSESVRSPRYAKTPLCTRHALMTPAEPASPRAIGLALLPATLKTVSASACSTYEAESLHAFALRLLHFPAYA